MNAKNENETKPNIFPWDVFTSDVKSDVRYSNDFQNQNFSVLWLQWSQTMEIKQNQTYFHGAFSSLTSFFIAHKILKYFSGFYSWHLFILLQKWAQTVKLNEIKRYMCKSDSIFLYLWHIIVPCLILDMIYISKMNDNSSQGKSISFNFIL